MKNFVGIVLLLLCFVMLGCGRQEARDDGYVGSKSCIECHERFYHLWNSSHHGKAMQPYSDEFAASNLSAQAQAQAVLIDGVSYLADISKGKGHITEKGPKGKKKYRIEHAMGGKNVYFFLTKLKRGRLQVMPLSYDVHEKIWFDTTASMVRHFSLEEDEALHWTDRLLTFNTACFNCHVSQLRKNYDLKTDTYKTVWGEPGINCETCHGPCDEHNKAFREAKGKKLDDLKLLSWKTLTSAQKNDACASCHAKAGSITTAFAPGEKFFDHFTLTCFEDRDFYPDGRDLGENYTQDSWMMSECVKSGTLDCIHCHTSSGRYRFKSENKNAACLPCHAERVKDIEAHSHHKLDKDDSPVCISCHMPLTRFGNMNRSDHSMRPPSPEATIKFKSPNACNMCHDDKKSEWAAEMVRKWHPKGKWSERIVNAGQLVQWARDEKWEHLPEILEYMEREDSDVIVVTSLIRLLATCRDTKQMPVLRRMTKHPSPLVRSSAATAVGVNDIDSVRSLLSMLADEYRLVRIRAADSLLGLERQMLPPDYRKAFDAAEDELVASFECRPDNWGSHYNYGNYYGQLGEVNKSIESYDLAIKMRPDVVVPYVNASMAISQLGDLDRAYSYLMKAYKLEPKSGAVNMNLGLLLAEQGDLEGAGKHLTVALDDSGSMPQAAYNLAVIVGGKDPAQAVELCKRALSVEHTNQKYQQALQYYSSKLPQ